MEDSPAETPYRSMDTWWHSRQTGGYFDSWISCGRGAAKYPRQVMDTPRIDPDEWARILAIATLATSERLGPWWQRRGIDGPTRCAKLHGRICPLVPDGHLGPRDSALVPLVLVPEQSRQRGSPRGVDHGAARSVQPRARGRVGAMRSMMKQGVSRAASLRSMPVNSAPSARNRVDRHAPTIRWKRMIPSPSTG